LKWIYLVMLLMFAFNTPGEHVHGWPFSLSPTHEGLLIGFTQILRITIVLAVLSLILAVNTKQQLIAGFYYLLLPLKFFGLDVERFAARLWLTLHYAEIERPKLTKTDFSNNLARSLGEIFNRAQHEEIVIILEKPVHTWLDYLLIILMLAFLSLATFRNFA
ncbi:MAG: hypothetical protein ACT4OH_07955, partial [Methylophilaceae bacterium]